MTDGEREKAARLLSALRSHWRDDPPEAGQSDVSASVMRTIRTRATRAAEEPLDAGSVWYAAATAAAFAAVCCFLVAQEKAALLDLGVSMLIEESGALPAIL